MKKFLLIASLFLVLFSCKKEEEIPIINLDKTTATLHHNETIQLTVTPTQSCTWTSLDTNVVTVSRTGLLTGVRIGDTKIVAKSIENNISAECVVHLTAQSFLFEEPYYTYGQTKEYVKGKETRELISETSDGLVFIGENSNIRYVIYSFENNGNTSVDVMFLNPTTTIELAKVFFDERYIYRGYMSLVAIYFDGLETFIGLNYDSTLGLNALYYQKKAKKSSAINNEYRKVEDIYNSLPK